MGPFNFRRLSKSSGSHQPSQNTRETPPSSYTPPLSHAAMLPNGASQHDSRPVSSTTDNSFEFTSRPMSQAMPSSNVGNLSRTDQIVLKHFWEYKFDENQSRDLHFLKFPSFGQFPAHKELVPYCEIYHLVKTSPGAKIISLGSANGVYIGFELFSGSQLHIDMDDEWNNISHYRVHFRDYESMLKDPASEATFKSWPKPLTIEWLEEQYQRWTQDLTSLCWEAKEVRELGPGAEEHGVLPQAQ